MRIAHTGLGQKIADPPCHISNIVNPVIDIINLSAPLHLALDRLADGFFIIFHDKGLNRQAVHRCLLQKAHITNADQAHMQGSRNGRSSKRKNINIGFHLLDLFLMGNAKSLLLVNDQKTQILILNFLGKEPVGSDHNIHQSLFQIRNGLFLLLRRIKTAEHIHPDRKILHSLAEGLEMLLSQNGRRNKINNLFSLLNRLKGSPDGHLCFSESDISADQTIHDLFALHISLDGPDGIQLILRFLIRKHLFKFSLPNRILSIDKAFLLLAKCIKIHQLLGDLIH